MPRPSRTRRIFECPQYLEFAPVDDASHDIVTLTMDEYEVIYLVDYEHQTHVECAKCMDISRTTVTEIYERARFKIADSIVNGKRILIAGGNYRISDVEESACYKSKRFNPHANELIEEKAEDTMRIAVTIAKDGSIFQHFGRSEEFKIYDIKEKRIVNSLVISTNGVSHGALVGFLMEAHVDVLICGGLGRGARVALNESGVELYPGIKGNVDDVIQLYLHDALTKGQGECKESLEHDHKCSC